MNMINPLEKLLRWRFYNIIEKLDINMDNFDYSALYQVRKNALKILNQKLISCGYVTLEESKLYGCYYIIKNIIWKNIISYELTQTKCYVHMLWNKNKTKHDRCGKYGYIVTNLIFNIDTYNSYESSKNLKILYATIIQYLLLLNKIISRYLLNDLTTILNMYIFDVILII